MPRRKRTGRELSAKDLRAMLAQGVKIPSLMELVGHLIEEAGGAQELARMIMSEYKDAPKGGVVRQRTLDAIVKLILQTSEFASAARDNAFLSEDDISRELDEVLTEAGFIDGNDEPGESSSEEVEEADGQEETAPVPVPKPVPDAEGIVRYVPEHQHGTDRLSPPGYGAGKHSSDIPGNSNSKGGRTGKGGAKTRRGTGK